MWLCLQLFKSSHPPHPSSHQKTFQLSYIITFLFNWQHDENQYGNEIIYIFLTLMDHMEETQIMKKRMEAESGHWIRDHKQILFNNLLTMVVQPAFLHIPGTRSHWWQLPHVPECSNNNLESRKYPQNLSTDKTDGGIFLTELT